MTGKTLKEMDLCTIRKGIYRLYQNQVIEKSSHGQEHGSFHLKSLWECYYCMIENLERENIVSHVM